MLMFFKTKPLFGRKLLRPLKLELLYGSKPKRVEVEINILLRISFTDWKAYLIPSDFLLEFKHIG